MCNLNDAVCDYDEDADDSTAAYARRVNVHTSYARTAGLDWTAPLYFLLGPAPAPATVSPMTPPTANELVQTGG